ncbi:error-prone DNA polymerase [Burkholderia pseudomallei]|uniref:error-prone DNA polymerase n=1 Tax=Burkholderia pseudomallei TaxID=28450 RepID=UPI00097575FE|nr:error-prone DNA polymerase [Burkholderia pseudomallei]MBM5620356.1 DNA polymerase III subunit alpha [Burkholderia pseudomallei]MBM5634752.1 DNA polymerase III subunit alpha [Burkholderia pseudomallei]MBM5663148.1 DNA polymerase III subunit alpha [Burkholderia pseudomallei]OMZ35909.1 error-prone DNA polymerase [Burkholderia pseudomallei]
MDAGSFGALPAYAELQVASDFSFLHGASRAEEYVARAAQLGYSAIAITDECSLAGVVRAHVEAKAANMPLIIGSHFRLTAADGTPAIAFTALAMNRDGYGNLCELVSLGRMRGKKGTYRLAPLDLEHPEAPYMHLRGLPDCIAILSPDFPANEQRLDAQVEWIARVFGERAWVALTLHARAMDDIHRGVVERVAARHGVPVVATSWPLMHVRSRKPLQDVLTGIRVGRPVSECGYELAPNAERHLRSRLRLANLYPADALEETVRVARRCTFSLDDLKYEYPDEVGPAGHDPMTYLREQTYIGARERYPAGVPFDVQAQIEHELELIDELNYAPYFLTVYDIVQFARSNGILCQGRGSAANSATCFCLHITSVDPARSNLLFERFISRERNEEPDIDLDVANDRREEIVQYLYRKYGRDRAALAAAVTTYRPRSALREAGKALGVDPAIVDRVAKQHHWFDSRADLLQRFAEAGLDPDAPLNQQWAGFAAQLLGYPRHLSQHPCGFVLSRGKLTRLVPIENAAMENRSCIQWDKDDLEALGLMKVDVLALGMLTALDRAFTMISEKRDETFELQDIPAEDKATYDMLCDGDSMGVFQVESRAQMSMLPRLRPQCFYDLVIEVAIVRPGPVQGGMVHPFLRRRQGLEPVTYPSPDIATALERTLGVPIFQEQVMQVAMLAAGFSAGEADQLRRAMAAWKRKGGLEPYHDRLVSGMLARGYDREFAEAIFAQIKGFGDYGFPESHAASFALLVYASAWLRRHEPAVFLTALLNSQPMGFYTPSQLLQDAKRRGVEVLPVDVNVSTWDSAIEGPTTSAPVRLGFSRLRGMREDVTSRIELARAARPFADVSDLARRAQLDRHDLQVLARANALRSLAGDNRRDALWLASAAVPDRDLLRGTERDDAVPALPQASEGHEIVTDYRAMGFTLGRHPLALLRDRLALDHLQSAEQLATLRSGQLARACGLVTVRQRPGTANGVLFMTLEDETGTVNVILWPGLLEKFRKEALCAALLAVYGVWQAEGKVRHLIASKLVDRSELLGALPTTSREFY